MSDTKIENEKRSDGKGDGDSKKIPKALNIESLIIINVSNYCKHEFYRHKITITMSISHFV